MKFFNISIIEPTVYDFFKKAIAEIMKQRKEDKSGKHHDFLQLMINAQKKVVDVEETDDKLMDRLRVLYNRCSKQKKNRPILCCPNLLSHLCYLLAINPDSQQKLLDEVLAKSDSKGDIDYETIIRLPYLDACISETLRLYNPAPQTSRVAAKDYQLGDTGITVKKGIHIMIPIHAIHHNPDYYPDPHSFKPERFLPENRDKLVPYTYLPFGAGPRNCVGMRFALMEAKTVMARVITKYEFIRTKTTKVPLQMKKGKIFMTPTDITIGKIPGTA
ncbi:unnamed protein product [Oppiella nova]|uniref:Cytochrome P450 n=1 Tax=Oppiella nova TaxID=334625 RepID=A0A7R9LAR6_9ACAR|nr:unnamed protein product [Oppiella nova]CAG2161675.1 unnamed protein product [Oppiella nova]